MGVNVVLFVVVVGVGVAQALPITQTLKCILNRFFIHSDSALEFIYVYKAMRCDYNN